MKKILKGNLDQLVTAKNNGWLMGAFVTKPLNFRTKGFELKWSTHKKGEKKGSSPVMDAETITILIKGKFSVSVGKKSKEILLKRKGDYVYFGKGVPHTWECLKTGTQMLTVRWPSIIRKKIIPTR